MKTWKALSCALLAAATLAVAATPAGARPPAHWVEFPRHLELTLATKASHGFDATLETAGHRQVTLVLERGLASATYTATGKVSRHGIEADFGAVGEVSLRFEGRPRPFRSPYAELRELLPPGLRDIRLPQVRRRCHGRKPEREVGQFKGSFRFAGENGFAALDLSHARGEVRKFYRRLCDEKLHFIEPRGRRSPRDVGRLNVLFARQSTAGQVLKLTSLNFEAPPGLHWLSNLLGTISQVSMHEWHEGVKVVRAAAVFDDRSAMLLSRPEREPSTATLSLGKPFRGGAELRKAKGSPPSWSGTLNTWLPGAGRLSMTGEGFEVELCRVPLSVELDENRCVQRNGFPGTESSQRRLGSGEAGFAAGLSLLAQLSGSQSQAF